MKGSRLTRGWKFVRQVWTIAAPYWSSEQKRSARLLLLATVGLSLFVVFMNVKFNDWYRDFYNALTEKDVDAFWQLLVYFCWLAAIYILVQVYRNYLIQVLQMRWRIWLTDKFIGRWLARQVYYRLELEDRRTDNPDQRIAEDLKQFAFDTLSIALGLIRSVVTLVTFITILWGISGPLSFALGGTQIEIPGYMVWAAILYAIVGTVLTHVVARRLIPINFQLQRVEADLRFGLIRIRENSEGIALYKGEVSELTGLRGRIENIRQNWRQYMSYTKRYIGFSNGYGQIALIFPFFVAAPRYLAGEFAFGVLLQISNAFGQVQDSLSWFVDNYAALASWKATVDRIITFRDAMDRLAAQADKVEGIQVVRNGANGLEAEHVDLLLPNGRAVLSNSAFTIQPGEKVLVSGPSGSGKTTLFRAIAGIWPYGSGRIEIPANAKLLFLPQKPYLPIAKLREAVSYPAMPEAFAEREIEAALRQVGLDSFIPRLDDSQNWTLQMSVGEQQRLAIARALLHKPDWLFLDEATAALDSDSVRLMYELIAEQLPHATIVSIAHDPELASFHERTFTLARDNGHTELKVDLAKA